MLVEMQLTSLEIGSDPPVLRWMVCARDGKMLLLVNDCRARVKSLGSEDPSYIEIPRCRASDELTLQDVEGILASRRARKLLGGPTFVVIRTSFFNATARAIEAH